MIAGLAATSDDACYRAMDRLTEITGVPRQMMCRRIMMVCSRWLAWSACWTTFFAAAGWVAAGKAPRQPGWPAPPDGGKPWASRCCHALSAAGGSAVLALPASWTAWTSCQIVSGSRPGKASLRMQAIGV